MAEELVAFINPLNGTTFRCVKSQLTKNPGYDPWNQKLTANRAKALGLELEE